MDPTKSPRRDTANTQPARPARGAIWGWYALLVLSWSGAWYAMKLQTAHTPPAVSIALRFGLAAPLMFAWALGRGASLRFDIRAHGLFMAMGALLFSLNFVFAYNAAIFMTSALVAVVFSLSSVVNLALGALWFGQRMSLRAVAGGVLGSSGLTLLVWTQIAAGGAGRDPWLGLLLACGMTLSFCIGSMVSTLAQRRGIAVAPATAWAMLWGAFFSAGYAALSGQSFHLEPSARYFFSLAFLVVFGSVLAFHAYFTLIGRVGASRAAYAMVMAPIGALLISSIFESYVWTASALLGLLVTLAGNVMVLGERRQADRTPPNSTELQKESGT